MQHLLSKPISDGGQYDMFVNLIEKYGLCPKIIFPDVQITKSSRNINLLINKLLREYACNIHKIYTNNKSITKLELQKLKKIQLQTIYKILITNFGIPPKSFIYSFKNNDNILINIKAKNPLYFYNKYIKQFFDVSKYYAVINDPRNEYYKLYTVSRLGNIINGKRSNIIYINIPINELKKYCVKMLNNQNGIWCGSDIRQFFYRKNGIMDINIYDYKTVFDINFVMNKKERIQYCQSLMAHSMVFTGYNIDSNGNIDKWRLENSWGDKYGDNGYCLMSDEWFDEYNFQVALPINILSKKLVELIHDRKPIKLNPWDPLAELCCFR